MAKKIIYIVLGALAVFGLLFLLWSWFFSGSSSPATTGTLGQAGDTTQNAGGSSDQNTNGQNNLGSNGVNGSQNLAGNTGANGSTGGGNIGSGGGTSATNNGGGKNNVSLGTNGNGSSFNNTLTTVPGVSWTGSPFNPTNINGIAGGSGGFVPTITSPNSGSNGSVSLITALAATAIAGSVSCAIQAGIVTLSAAGATAAASGAVPAALAVTVAPPYSPGTSPGLNLVADLGTRTLLGLIYAQQVKQSARTAAKDPVTFAQCITNVIAKAALQQITISVVNWINSGFNGQPAFVTNFQQFFTNVADSAAGQFIQGSGLAFLCSPFKAQIKIAIAQSYANRTAQSCTLTSVIKNVNSFMSGNFAQGGWGGLVSFTTVPTNNPYGAYAYAQLGLQTAQQNALANSKNNISPTGFLNLQQLSGCTNPANNGIGGGFSLGVNPQAAVAGGKASLPPGCTAKVITPGGAIADSLGVVSKSGVDQLGLASSIDQIITALTNQLLVKVLQGGLTSLSQPTTQTPADIAAQSTALSLLTDMQNRTTLAQQLGAIYQGSISDLESTEANVNGLVNCWGSVASSTNDSSAAQNAAKARDTFASLDRQITTYNNAITGINNGITILNQFESDISTASSQNDVALVNANYNAAVASGTFVSASDLTTAQQNRATLQAQMAAVNQSTSAGINQCNAFAH